MQIQIGELDVEGKSELDSRNKINRVDCDFFRPVSPRLASPRLVFVFLVLLGFPIVTRFKLATTVLSSRLNALLSRKPEIYSRIE